MSDEAQGTAEGTADVAGEAQQEAKPSGPVSKNAELYKQAAQNYIDTPNMTQKAACESVGLKANAYNCRKTMELVPPELAQERSKNRSADTEEIKAAAEAFAADGSLSKKAALEAQGIKYNGYRIKKMDKFLEGMDVVEREARTPANDEALTAAAQMKLDKPETTKRACLEQHGIPYNAYNIGKLNAKLDSVKG